MHKYIPHIPVVFTVHKTVHMRVVCMFINNDIPTEFKCHILYYFILLHGSCCNYIISGRCV